MQKLKFWKMSGAGNDFVLLAEEGQTNAELKKLALALCDRERSIGADGLLCVGRSGDGPVTVKYFNRDGSEAFCGNGSRCAALWACEYGLSGGWAFALRTSAGDLQAEIMSQTEVKMRMPSVSAVSLRHKGTWPKPVKVLHFLNTGVPHAVVPVADVDKVSVAALGAALRCHKAFGRAGANVNFVQEVKGALKVRTFERGVEAETLACGTGITAAAVALGLTRDLPSPVSVQARSGDKFKVWFSSCGKGASDIFVQGPARTVFSGEIYV